MAMLTKSQRLVYIFGAWALIVLVLMALLRSLNYEYFFILALIGFIIIVLLSGPFTVKPAWRSRVNIVIILGALVFCAIVVKETLDIIGLRIFP
jgi:hypothetical protein